MGIARLYKVGSPYNAVDLEEVDYEQTADTMYLAHLNYPVTKLVRGGHTSWSFADVTFGPTLSPPTGLTGVAYIPNTDDDNDGNSYFPQPASYVVTAVDDDSGQESRASNSVTFTNDLTLKRNYNSLSWTGVTGAERYRVYKADNSGSYGYIGTTESTAFRDDNIGPDLTDGPPKGENPFAASGDYPSTVTFHEQRLMLGRTINKPNGVWGSQSADFENFDTSTPLKADDSLSFVAVGQKVNSVNQLVSFTDLLLLTSDGLIKVNGGDDAGGYLSATQIVARKQSGRGSSRLNPLVIDSAVFFKPKVGTSVRAIGFKFEINGFSSNDVAIYSPHLFRNMDITSWAYAQDPLSCIWAARDDGKLLCFTWEAEQEVWGWTICETDGFVEQLCVISEIIDTETQRTEDRLYLVVRRAFGDGEKRFLERMASPSWENVIDACHLDCAVSYAFDEPTQTLTNLHHLEGRTISALADGNVQDGLIVTDGKAFLPVAAKVIHAGIPYTATVETLPLSFPLDGTNMGKQQMVGRAVLRLVNTRGLFAGPDQDSLYELKPRLDEPWGEPAHLLSEDVEVDMEPVAANQSSLIIRQSYPLPFTLTAAFLDPIVTEDA
ncbi:hypothetical protein [Flavisphingomonas formosensis]|uniref:hypothetical protein n=1 Tax=Flavisphingomonas formosensis TaxID=861534 RepID=UPI0012F86694|nr:hypothetical protein [Sphingomonas formosensis]